MYSGIRSSGIIYRYSSCPAFGNPILSSNGVFLVTGCHIKTLSWRMNVWLKKWKLHLHFEQILEPKKFLLERKMNWRRRKCLRKLKQMWNINEPWMYVHVMREVDMMTNGYANIVGTPSNSGFPKLRYNSLQSGSSKFPRGRTINYSPSDSLWLVSCTMRVAPGVWILRNSALSTVLHDAKIY